MCRIKLCSIPEIFFCYVKTNEYCEQNETLENFFTKRRLVGEFLVNESRAHGLCSLRDKDSIDWFSLALLYIKMIILTQVAYVVACAYRYCLLISKQCTYGLVCPRNSSDFLDRI